MAEYRAYGRLDDPGQSVGDSKFVGVNNRLAPDQLGPGFLADAVNVRLRSGQPETRLGLVKPGWLNVSDSGAIKPVGIFYGSGVFKDPNGQEWVLLAADGQIFRCTPANARFALSLPSGVKIVTPCVPVQAFNNVFLFRGRYLKPLVMTDINAGFTDILPLWDAAGTYQAAVLAAGIEAQEIAYGPFLALGASGSLTSVGQTATMVTTAEHGFITGTDVQVLGAVETAYNIRATVTVLDLNTFTYPFAGAASPATGTPKVSNMSHYWRALGTRWTLASITRVAAVATATKAAHGFLNTQSVTISGATGADAVLYNGTFVIQNVTANTFDYVMAGTPAGAATGVLVAQGSVVQAGQSPDSNPEAWQQIFNVIPNADDAIFTDNRLLIPTAYTPGDTSYDSTSSYTKKDFIVAMDVGDNVHFFFNNQLRINQGSSDEIVGLVVFDADSVIVLKGLSWGILTGLSSGDLTQVRLDMKTGTFGCCAPRAGISAGKNVLFPTSQRGISSLAQNLQGETRSVDIPFSNDFEALIKRINWSQAAKIRTAWWDDKFYVAVPLLDFQVPPPNLVPAGAVYNALPGGLYSYDITSLLQSGQTYQFTPGANEGFVVILASAFVQRGLETAGTFVYDGVQASLVHSRTTVGMVGPFPPIPVTARISAPWIGGCNNALLVYDFRRSGGGASWTYDFQAGQWDGYDTGWMLCVKEFFQANLNGRLRLFFIGEDGWANLIEEADGGLDQTYDASSLSLKWSPFTSQVDTRGYNDGEFGLNKFRGMEAALGIWGSVLNIFSMTGLAGKINTVRQALSFSRTKYLKPVGKADYVEGNVNGDFASPGRGDYSVTALPAGNSPGFSCGQFQEVTVRSSTRPTLGRYVQLRISCTGRMRIKEINEAVAPGLRRDGVLI